MDNFKHTDLRKDPFINEFILILLGLVLSHDADTLSVAFITTKNCVFSSVYVFHASESLYTVG